MKPKKIYLYKNVHDAILQLHVGTNEDGQTRFMICGANPFIVQTETWFEGITLNAIQRDIEAKGFKYMSTVPLDCYDINSRKGNECSSQKGNESFYDSLPMTKQVLILDCVHNLDVNGEVVLATRLYKMIRNVGISEALNAVREMRTTEA